MPPKSSRRNGRAQAQIIEDLLDMSRIISGKMRLDVQSVDLSEVVGAAVETVRPAAQAKEIHLHTVLDPRAGSVLGDAGRLQQVIWNLLSNAIKFTPKHGRVQIARPAGEFARRAVGLRHRPRYRPRVPAARLRSFPSARRDHHAQFGGLGLGLSIVKHLVEQHGGTVSVSSPGEGQGSTFVVALPLQIVHVDETGEPRNIPTAPLAKDYRFHSPDIGGLNVLVVDDEADARDLMKRLLEEHRVTVAVAQGADEALKLIGQACPDVIVSDIGMPGTDGYQFIRSVRALGDNEGGRVPAVAATAFARSEDRTRALLAGYQAYVTKPVNAHELIAVLAAVAGKTSR